MVLFLSWVSDEEAQPDECLPVNDVLDVVMHALVVSSSVWLDVKCNLGKQNDHSQRLEMTLKSIDLKSTFGPWGEIPHRGLTSATENLLVLHSNFRSRQDENTSSDAN